MKRTLVVMAAVIMLLGIANMALATQSRTAVIGKAWMFDGDFEDIYFYPQALAVYPRMLVGEMGTFPADFQNNGSAAITFANEEQTWGVAGLDINHKIAGEYYFSDYIDVLNFYLGIGDVIPSIDSKYHLFYAKEVSGLSLGLHIARAAGAYNLTVSDTVAATTDGDIEGHSGIWDFNVGLGYALMENMEANLGFSLKTYSFSGEQHYTWPGLTGAVPENNTVESDGGSGIDVAFQVLYGLSDNFSLVPTAGLSTLSLGYETSYTDTAAYDNEAGSLSSTNIWAGFGANYTPMENVRIIGGLDFGYYSETIEDSFAVGIPGEIKAKRFMFPGFCAALEADVLKWLTLRIGAGKDIAKTTINYDYTTDLTEIEYSETSADYNYAFGIGLKFGRLNIDAKLNDNMPYSLGYFISGIDNDGDVTDGLTHTEPITQVSASYKF